MLLLIWLDGFARTSGRAPPSRPPPFPPGPPPSSALRRKSILELAIRQSGSEPAKLAAELAEDAAVKEGTGTGSIKVRTPPAEQRRLPLAAARSPARLPAKTRVPWEGAEFFRVRVIRRCAYILPQVMVRQPQGPMEHPVHVGGKANALFELKINPEVKKPAGK
jgi:hypothetical protein